MATTNRLLQDFISFSTDVDPGSAGVTLSAPGLADLLVVSDPDFIALTLDPEEIFGSPEIVWVSVHTSSATTATIVRAREGTSARAHDIGTKVIVPITSAGLVHDQLAGLGDDDHTEYLLADGSRGVTGSLDPATDVADDLGTASLSWRNAYLEKIFDASGVNLVDMDNAVLQGVRWAVEGDFDPNSDVTFDLGNADFTWDKLYAQDLHNAAGAQVVSLANSSLVGGWTAQNIDPIADVTHDLGDATKTWRRLYVDDIYDRVGTRIIDVDAQVLDNGTWKVDGSLYPEDDIAHSLGSSTLSWKNLYVQDLKSEAGSQILDLSAKDFAAGTWEFLSGSVVRIDRNSRTVALQIISQQSVNNVDHASIEFLSDVSNGSKIVGYRDASSTRMGIKFYGYNAGNAEGPEVTYQGHFRPILDNQRLLGGSSNRWTAVWAVDGSINTSDLREKRNVAAMRYGLNTVMAIEPIEYEWNSGRGGKRLGFGAQAVLPIIPEAVVVDEDPDVSLGQNSDMMLAVLWNAVRDLKRELDAQ